jgi:hypothetical protein
VPIDLLPGFDAAARAVAYAGLPADAPVRAVWCLVAAMVAAKGAVPWARTLLRLTGHFRCGQCQSWVPGAPTVAWLPGAHLKVPDPLPPDPAHSDVVAVAASAGLVVTAGRASRNLRIWQPSSGRVALVPLPFAPEWLTFTGTILTAGHADGAVSFSGGAEAGPR